MQLTIREVAQEILERVTKQKINKSIEEKRKRVDEQFKKAQKIKKDRLELSQKASELFRKRMKMMQRKR